MVVQLKQPCRVRYRRRAAVATTGRSHEHRTDRATATQPCRIVVDLDLCQGHSVCASEAPEIFKVDKPTNKVQLLVDTVAPELRAKAEKAVQYCPTHALKIEELDS
jgi:ferredoxin